MSTNHFKDLNLSTYHYKLEGISMYAWLESTMNGLQHPTMHFLKCTTGCWTPLIGPSSLALMEMHATKIKWKKKILKKISSCLHSLTIEKKPHNVCKTYLNRMKQNLACRARKLGVILIISFKNQITLSFI